MKQYDERDTMFARMSLEVGSHAYNQYYAIHPGLQASDDLIRSKPGLLSEGTATYDALRGPFADANFSFMNHIMSLCTPAANTEKTITDASEMTRLIKGMTTYYGAGSVGIARMTDDMYYSHRGRREHIGQPIDASQKHTFGIVFTIPMDIDMMMYAPGLPETIETSNAYLKGATIGMQISYYIASLGYSVRNHMDANYLVIAPRVAKVAGLGVFGRQGMIITPEHGPNVRLGVVTTDMPLETDEPLDWDIVPFCKACKKCAKTCPGKAITLSDDETEWKIIHENCYNRWRSLGTDCGICLVNCPFTHRMADLGNIEGSLKAYEDMFGIRPYKSGLPNVLKG